MDPVQKAVINHTFGIPQPLKKKQIISCNICHLRFNSTVRHAALALCFGVYEEERDNVGLQGRETDSTPDCVI